MSELQTKFVFKRANLTTCLLSSFALLSSIVATSVIAHTEEESGFIINIENHQFSPSELSIPADKKVKLTIINKDATAEEFESHSMNREKVIKGNSQAIIFIGPLKAGTYDYFGEFHQETAKGKIIAK